MKRLRCLLLILALLPLLSGCDIPEEHRQKFYYLRTSETIRHGQADALIAPVLRSIADQDAELDYLLQLYLEGPAEEGFRSPFPKSTYLLSSRWDGETLVLVLSREFSQLNKIDLTLAGACLAATCYDLAGAQRIEVRSAEQLYEFDLNHYTFLEGNPGQ